MNYYAQKLTSEFVPFISKIYDENREFLNGIPISLEEWEQCFCNEDANEVNFIIMQDKNPVAWLKINGLQKGEIWISMLVVKNSMHHKGAGTFAVKFTEYYGKVNNKKAILIQTTKNNKPAISLYQKCGYNIIDEICYNAGGGTSCEGYKFKKYLIDN